MGYLTPPPAPAPVIVYKDVGGLVSEYRAQTEIYRREGREVRLHECRSACTLALSLPNVCVYPSSLVKFHLAYNAIDRQTDAGVSDELFSSYPAAVRGRLGYLTRQYKVLTGTELIALGIRNCNGDGTMIARARTAPPPVAAAATDPLSDIAEKVQGAVAQAFADPAAPRAPLRLALAERDRLAASGAIDPSTTASIRAASEASPLLDAPPPPRRPPSEAFAAPDARPAFEGAAPPAAAPARLIIPGGQPFLTAGVFVLPPPAPRADEGSH